MNTSCARAPITTEIIERMAERMNTKVLMAGFSRMAEGTNILPHVDNVGVTKRIHLAIKVPMFGDCGFEVDGVKTEWREGKAFLFNPQLIHSAWNRGLEDRVVLLVDFENVS